VRHFNDHFIAEDLEGAQVPPGWDGSMLMYNRSTLRFTRPGQRPRALSTYHWNSSTPVYGRRADI